MAFPPTYTTEEAQFGRICDDYDKWANDRARPRSTFYGSEGDLVTMITCVPEYALKYLKLTPDTPVKVELEFTARHTDSQGKPVIACVLSVKKSTY